MSKTVKQSVSDDEEQDHTSSTSETLLSDSCDSFSARQYSFGSREVPKRALILAIEPTQQVFEFLSLTFFSYTSIHDLLVSLVARTMEPVLREQGYQGVVNMDDDPELLDDADLRILYQTTHSMQSNFVLLALPASTDVMHTWNLAKCLLETPPAVELVHHWLLEPHLQVSPQKKAHLIIGSTLKRPIPSIIEFDTCPSSDHAFWQVEQLEL